MYLSNVNMLIIFRLLHTANAIVKLLIAQIALGNGLYVLMIILEHNTVTPKKAFVAASPAKRMFVAVWSILDFLTVMRTIELKITLKAAHVFITQNKR